MTKLFIQLLCCSAFLLVSGQSFTEKYRLQVHYSMPSGWANDPNGLVYVNGYYHLYYQHNPIDIVFGKMHWGHARSTDLIHWEHLPIALEPYEKGDIFSGCCVWDKENATGLVPAAAVETVIAIYTIHDDTLQTQGLAYSHDNGLTWAQYDGNPVIPNPGIPDFRDPNIFERNGKFYMALAVADRIRFLSSSDLLEWEALDDFGVSPNEGDKTGVWECPTLFALKDEQGAEHDILIVSENGDRNGSLTQYFIGKFNGSRFNSDDTTRFGWIENGYDNYAAIPYHNDPRGRIILIGWMSNWLYAQQTPSPTWRGQWTIPREITLKTVDGNLHVVQRPIDEFNSIMDSTRNWSLSTPVEITGNQIVDLTSQIPFKTGSLLSLEYVIDIENAQNADGQISLQFGNELGEFVAFNIDIGQAAYEFDRRNSGNVSFSPRFVDRVPRAARISTSNLVTGQIILDTASIEIFADDGLNVFSALFYPTEPFESIKLVGTIENSGKTVTVQKINVIALNSIWPK